ncbi:hypothetical protein OF83DRAFT_363226 [Amylostereum chailletii]|nr:hypothetical protein OF83DRAFT_363226 [Amylostereum chailletii]
MWYPVVKHPHSPPPLRFVFFSFFSVLASDSVHPCISTCACIYPLRLAFFLSVSYNRSAPPSVVIRPPPPTHVHTASRPHPAPTPQRAPTLPLPPVTHTPRPRPRHPKVIDIVANERHCTLSPPSPPPTPVSPARDATQLACRGAGHLPT